MKKCLHLNMGKLLLLFFFLILLKAFIGGHLLLVAQILQADSLLSEQEGSPPLDHLKWRSHGPLDVR